MSHFSSQVSSISDFNLPFPFTSHYTSFHFDPSSILSSVNLNQFFFFFQQIQLSRQLYQSHSMISNHRTVFRIDNNSEIISSCQISMKKLLSIDRSLTSESSARTLLVAGAPVVPLLLCLPGPPPGAGHLVRACSYSW